MAADGANTAAATVNGPLATAAVVPDKGEVTWASEGAEGGSYHSRKLHVPTDSSGLTIGRGYDMGQKSAGTIVNDLAKAGVSKEDADRISGAAGLKGADARDFIISNDLESFEITQPSQKLLFDTTYDFEEAEAKRLATKEDVSALYGITDWDKLDPAIKDILVDMKFRGDYNGTARTKLQKFVANNDLEGFAASLCERGDWSNVPGDRFNRRKAFLDKVVADRKRKILEAKRTSAVPTAGGKQSPGPGLLRP